MINNFTYYRDKLSEYFREPKNESHSFCYGVQQVTGFDSVNNVEILDFLNSPHYTYKLTKNEYGLLQLAKANGYDAVRKYKDTLYFMKREDSKTLNYKNKELEIPIEKDTFESLSNVSVVLNILFTSCEVEE